MRGKRSKQYRKLMQQYGLTFGFREPYQVLIDPQMIQDASRFKMDLIPSLSRTLHGQVKPMITQCSIRTLYSLPTIQSASTTAFPPAAPAPALTHAERESLIAQARTYERRRCNHHTLPEPLSTLECIKSILDPKDSQTNKNRYVLAVQEEEVRRWARSVRGVPMVYIKRSVMIMEPMSEQSEGVRLGVEKGKLRGGVKPGMASVKRKREDDEENVNGGEKAGEEKEKKKRKIPGPKGPNPLSVKKPKKPATPAEEEGAKERPTTSRKVKTIPEKATDTLDAVGGAGNDSKRKRKRKHKPPTEKGPDALVTGGNAGDESS